MKKNWILTGHKADYVTIAKKYNIDPVTAIIMRNRGVDIENDDSVKAYLYADLSKLYDPHLLKDADAFSVILEEKVRNHKKIRVITDYDIDGVQSSVIAKKMLRDIGADFDLVIPHRIEDGYGISIDLIKQAITDGIDTIITCDNGISAIEPIAYAKENGLTILVTDHHEIPYEEVNGEKEHKHISADAIVNPKQEDCNYPFKGLCGAAVIWKVAQVVYERFGFSKEHYLDTLENVAFATIGDVMELVDENRIIVKHGLSCMQNSKSVGLNALIKESGLQGTKITSYHIGFVLGPCINASGRLDTAKLSLELLEETDEQKASSLAKTLVELNTERKALTEEGIKEAENYLIEHHMLENSVYVIYLPNLHESLNGIVAGKIKEKYYRPTFVFSDGTECIKGSGRSIDGYSMYDELVKVSEYMLGFGGHPLAAGLSIKDEDTLNKFYDALLGKCQLTEEELTPKVMIDVAMPLEYISEKVINEFELLEPFGNANKKPVFATKHAKITGLQVIGANKDSVKLILMTDSGYKMTSLLFKRANELKEMLDNALGESAWEGLLLRKEVDAFLDIVYYPSVNEFRGIKELQVIISDFRIG